AWSLSHIGPMTRTVADAAMMMNVCAGPDERDQYSLPAPRVDYVKALRGSVKGLRVAYSDDLGGADAVDPEVRAVSAKAALAFRELGCRVETVDPRWPSPRDCWEQTFCGGAMRVHQRGAADRTANRRASLRRCGRPGRRRGVRARPSLGRPAPAHRLGGVRWRSARALWSMFPAPASPAQSMCGRHRRGGPVGGIGGSGVAPPDVDHGAAALHRVLGAAGAVREPAACPRPRERRRHHPQSQEGETSPAGGAPFGRSPAIPAALEAP